MPPVKEKEQKLPVPVVDETKETTTNAKLQKKGKTANAKTQTLYMYIGTVVGDATTYENGKKLSSANECWLTESGVKLLVLSTDYDVDDVVVVCRNQVRNYDAAKKVFKKAGFKGGDIIACW